jgi:hypothetical protein
MNDQPKAWEAEAEKLFPDIMESFKQIKERAKQFLADFDTSNGHPDIDYTEEEVISRMANFAIREEWRKESAMNTDTTQVEQWLKDLAAAKYPMPPDTIENYVTRLIAAGKQEAWIEAMANREKDIGDAWDDGADAQFHRMSHTVDFGYMGKRKASYIEQVKNKQP